MIAFPGMLLAPAEKAGMKFPADPENYDPSEYPHFHVFSIVQLGSPMPTPYSHWTNATIIAAIPEDKIKLITPEELESLGIEIGYPLP